MSLSEALSMYLNLNLLIAIGFLGLGAFSCSLKLLGFKIAAAAELRLHYGMLTVVLGLTALHPLIPQAEIFSPAAKVWSAPSIDGFDNANTSKGGYLSVPTPLGTSTVQANAVSKIWLVLVLLLLVMGGLRIVRDVRTLTRIKRCSFLVRRFRRVRIFIHDEIQVPFSFWLPGQANVILPSAFIARSGDYKMAVCHELQHHRQGDTRWVYLLWGMKIVCILNPAIHLWNRLISEIQEFACDETLVDQSKVESQAYARCLVQVAQTAIDRRSSSVCATGLIHLIERNILKRRIERMFSKTSYQLGRSITVAVGIVLASIMGTAAYGSKGLIQDRRVNLTQAKAMAAQAQSKGGFPIVVNDLVLKQLNRYIGTPEGREFMRDSLARMQNYKDMIGEQLQSYGLPSEIMAVPIIESGYQNLPESKNSAWPTWKAAGVWQFIRQTARNYGLVVSPKRDDRLNVEMLTDAAMRYLQSNNLRFKDWHLAALAYNMGEDAVQRGIEALGTRDAWALIRNGHEGDKDYLPKLVAAILIMRNPESVE